jgi:hypothetical protein
MTTPDALILSIVPTHGQKEELRHEQMGNPAGGHCAVQLGGLG